MKIRLWEFLENSGNIEISVKERLANGKEQIIAIGYPEEIEETLKHINRTEYYNIFYIQGIKHNILEVIVNNE